jgi:hypothetical protein
VNLDAHFSERLTVMATGINPSETRSSIGSILIEHAPKHHLTHWACPETLSHPDFVIDRSFFLSMTEQRTTSSCLFFPPSSYRFSERRTTSSCLLFYFLLPIVCLFFSFSVSCFDLFYCIDLAVFLRLHHWPVYDWNNFFIAKKWRISIYSPTFMANKLLITSHSLSLFIINFLLERGTSTLNLSTRWLFLSGKPLKRLIQTLGLLAPLSSIAQAAIPIPLLGSTTRKI